MLGTDVDWDRFVMLLRKSIDGGCGVPMLRPAYTAHLRIQMPRLLSEEEQTYLQVALDLLPCNCLYVPAVRGVGYEMHVYTHYQGG